MKRHPSPVSGFTLIELLVVIAVIAILASILFPVFASAKKRAQQATCASNMRQIGMAMSMYTADNKDRFPPPKAPSPKNPASMITWGKYYWMFTINRYTNGKPASWDRPAESFFVCPTEPVKHALSGSRTENIFPEPATSWGLRRNQYRVLEFWCSYSINEWIVDDAPGFGFPFLGSWENPAGSFMVLESSDTEIEGDELDELRWPHQGGTNILFIDGHVQWHRVEYTGPITSNPQTGLRVTSPDPRHWKFPPASSEGDDDRGPWTPRGDD